MQALQKITNSRTKAFRLCKRFHFYRYERGIGLRSKPYAMTFGSIFHAAMEAWWSYWMAGASEEDALSCALAACRDYFRRAAEDGQELSEFDLVKSEELMLGYHFRWVDNVRMCKVLAVEAQFDAPLINPLTGKSSRVWTLSGKVDAIISVDGKAFIVEHKTSTQDIQPGSDYWTRLRMDGQISTYFDGGQSLGHQIEGCLYDVAKRPTLQPRKATPEESRKFTKGKTCKRCKGSKCVECNDTGWEDAPRLYAGMRDRDETVDEYRDRLHCDIFESPDDYYQRGEVVRLEDDLQEFRFDAWVTAKGVRDHQLLERSLGRAAWPRNPDACYQYSRFCEFYDVCTNAASLDDPRFVVQGVHPELNEEPTI